MSWRTVNAGRYIPGSMLEGLGCFGWIKDLREYILASRKCAMGLVYLLDR